MYDLCQCFSKYLDKVKGLIRKHYEPAADEDDLSDDTIDSVTERLHLYVMAVEAAFLTNSGPIRPPRKLTDAQQTITTVLELLRQLMSSDIAAKKERYDARDSIRRLFGSLLEIASPEDLAEYAAAMQKAGSLGVKNSDYAFKNLVIEGKIDAKVAEEMRSRLDDVGVHRFVVNYGKVDLAKMKDTSIIQQELLVLEVLNAQLPLENLVGCLLWDCLDELYASKRKDLLSS